MNIEIVWDRIKACEGEAFHQMRGKEFSYIIIANSIKLSTTNRSISKKTFDQALSFVPLSDTTPIQHLQAPSYIYAILMDNRIRTGSWK